MARTTPNRETRISADTDFVFPSQKKKGRVPLSPALFVADHLRPAAITAGVKIEPGQRVGLPNLRHLLSSWLVNKAKIEPKTVQSIQRHSRTQTTLDLYTQSDGDETRAAQGAFLKEMGLATEMIQRPPVDCGLKFPDRISATCRKQMVGAIGFETMS